MRRTALAFLIAAAGCQDRPPADPAPPAQPTPPPAAAAPARADEPADVGNGQELANEFRANVIGAGRKWGGRRVRLWNEVLDVGQDRGGDFLLLYSFKVYGTDEAFGRLRKGDKVVVEGVVQTYRGAEADLEVILSAGRFVGYRGQK